MQIKTKQARLRANEGGEGGCDQILRDRFAFGARDRDQGSREVEVVEVAVVLPWHQGSTNTTTTGAREREIWIKRISRRAGCLRTSRIIEWHFHFSSVRSQLILITSQQA